MQEYMHKALTGMMTCQDAMDSLATEIQSMD